MTHDHKDGTGLADRTLDRAKDAVNSASAQVDEVGSRLTDAVEKARRPETYFELLKSATVAAPVAMLVTAFVAGALFGSRRRH